MEKKNWYDNKVIVIILMIVFFPIGLYALWKSRTIAIGWKIGWSAIICLIVLGSIMDEGDGERSVSSRETVKEIRVAKSTGINIRTGPGADYEVDKKGYLYEGEKIYVLDETNGWFKFRSTPNDIGWTGWVSKALTLSEEEVAMANRRAEIKKIESSINELISLGVVTRLNAEQAEVFVNPAQWNRISFQAKEQTARMLGTYCGLIRDSGVNRVDIKDHYSGKRLGTYSDAWGFRPD